VTVHDIRPNSGGAVSDMRAGRDVAKSDVPAHAKARDPERKVRGELRKSLLRVLAAGRSIRHEAHTMPECRLGACKIKHMAEESSDGSAQHMQDVEAAAGLQSHRDSLFINHLRIGNSTEA
jgi:hypothetical protein